MGAVDLSASNIDDLSFEKCLQKLNSTRTIYERENGIRIYPFRVVLRLPEICLLERETSDSRKCIAIMFHIGRGKWFNIIPTEQQLQVLFGDLKKIYDDVELENSSDPI